VEEERNSLNYMPRLWSELGLIDFQAFWPDATWRTPQSFTCRRLHAALCLATSRRVIDVRSGSDRRHSEPDRRA